LQNKSGYNFRLRVLMHISLHDPESTELATGFTVADYNHARDSQDKEQIAEAIRRRFTERYINPALDTKARHGFSMMRFHAS
jgi:hypothetical protein